MAKLESRVGRLVGVGQEPRASSLAACTAWDSHGPSRTRHLASRLLAQRGDSAVVEAAVLCSCSLVVMI